MKHLKDILIFFSVLGIVFLVLNIHFSKKRKQLQLCSPHDIISFSIGQKEETLTMTLKKEEEPPFWEVAQGSLRDQAHEIDLDRLLNLMCHLPYVEKYPLEELSQETTSPDLTPFGLTPPLTQITLFTLDQTILLFFGNDTPAGTEFYLQTSVEPETIYTLPNRLRRMLFSSYMDLRIRNPFYNLSQIKTMTLQFDLLPIKLQREGETWKVIEGKLSPEELSQLLNHLEHFHYKNYHEAVTKEELESYNLHLPDLTIKVEKEDGNHHSYSLVQYGGRYYLSMEFFEKSYILILDYQAPSSLYKLLGKIIESHNEESL